MKKLLVVDDVMFNRELLLTLLESHFEVRHTAANGCEAVEAFKKSIDELEPYDLICLDIMMPEMDGQTALEEIRKIEQQKGFGGKGMVKVIMVTALEGKENIANAFHKGSCDGYLTKPIIPEKLDEYLKKFGLYQC